MRCSLRCEISYHVFFLSICILLFKPVSHIDDLLQDCSNSIANALELLQSYTKPSICLFLFLSTAINYIWLLYLQHVHHFCCYRTPCKPVSITESLGPRLPGSYFSAIPLWRSRKPNWMKNWLRIHCEAWGHFTEIEWKRDWTVDMNKTITVTSSWRDGVSNHWRLDCLLNRLFRRRSRK